MQLLSARQVAARLSVSRSHLYALMSKHDFPVPVKVGGRTTWLETEVDAWIAARVEARAHG